MKKKNEKIKEFEIKMVLSNSKNKYTEDELLDMFLNWAEFRGINVGGSIKKITDDGVSLEDAITEMLGEEGTPERDEFEKEIQAELERLDKHEVSRHECFRMAMNIGSAINAEYVIKQAEKIYEYVNQ